MAHASVSQVPGLVRRVGYRNGSAVETHAKQVLLQTTGLRPDVVPFFHNNGSSETLFKLHGTIPITYQHRQYNIPVAIWMPRGYPQQPPMCYVVPTANMKVKPKHRHVDPQGFIYHPYLHSWPQNPRANLVELIGLLSSVFGADPPVYAVPAGQQQASRASQPPAKSMVAYGAQPMPMKQMQASQSQPAYSAYGQPPRQVHVVQPAQAISRPATIHQAYGPGSSMGASGGAFSGGGPGSSGPRPSGGSHSGAGGGAGSAMAARKEQKRQERMSRESSWKRDLESKLRSKLTSVYSKENGELNRLASEQKRLDIHRAEIEEMERQVMNEKRALEERRALLSEKTKILEAWLKENPMEKKVDINQLVLCSDTWSRQCIEEVANDFAFTDSMLELDRMLEDDVFTLPQYIKQLRKLAREQFMHRALARVIFEKQNSAVQALQSK